MTAMPVRTTFALLICALSAVCLLLSPAEAAQIIAFQRDVSPGAPTVWAWRDDGSPEQQLDGPYACNPTVSSDGGRIVYTYSPDGDSWEISPPGDFSEVRPLLHCEAGPSV